MIRIIVYWGLYWGPQILGNYHIYIICVPIHTHIGQHINLCYMQGMLPYPENPLYHQSYYNPEQLGATTGTHARIPCIPRCDHASNMSPLFAFTCCSAATVDGGTCATEDPQPVVISGHRMYGVVKDFLHRSNTPVPV